MNSKFYITTPIYYVNDKPHIGHAYTTILADVLARFHREAGEDVFFLTGLDEHGQKVQQAAEKRGVPPQQHCDEMAQNFLELWEKLHIRYDDFIRTTEPRHVKVVQDVLQKVYDAGDIYTSEYEGWYSVAEERFITQKEVESGAFRDVRKLKETNYFFRMGKYQQDLLDHIEAHPEFIQPESRRNEILGFLRQPLGDLCISRPKSRLNWGIELPFDPDYVTYVWFDALLNYVTAPGYGVDEERFRHWWPADYHLIGKDIITTHAVYWPTMLFSAGIPQPKTIFAHGWWLMEQSKMSKSLGNIVNPLDLIDQFGVDPVRYYLMREMVLGLDADFSMASFVKRYNSDLANDFGNLLNRVTRLIGRHFDSCIPEYRPGADAEEVIARSAQETRSKVHTSIERLRINEAIEDIMQFVRGVNRYLEQQAPWKLVKTDLDRAGVVLGTAAEAIRFAAVLLRPVMPNRTRQVFDTLGVHNPGLTWGELPPGQKVQPHGALFPRIDVKGPAAPEPPKEKAALPDNVITFDEFEKVELRTARVTAARKVEGADKLLQLDIDLGSETRQIVAGIAPYYDPRDLPGKMIVVVANLQPATIRGLKSEGMLLAAKSGQHLSLITVDGKDAQPGKRVF